uniref:Uncharacterized protein n=1 Tax=Peronospora matthiolae TaxID=2874970 RepID=A0AAV1VMI7_9STRA
MGKAIDIPSMGEWNMLDVEGATSHELALLTHEHVMDALTPGTLELIAPRTRAVPARHHKESHWPLVPALVMTPLRGFGQ